MYQQTYFVDKQTGTFADVCSAYGLATILDELLQRALGERGSHTVRILDRGTTYAIELAPALQAEWVEDSSFFAPISFIKTVKTAEKMPEDIDNVDYEEEKRVYDEYRESRRVLRQTMSRGVSANEKDHVLPPKPLPEYPVWQKINVMGALTTYNDATSIWYANREHFAEILKLLLKLHQQTPNVVPACEQEWKAQLKSDKPKKGKSNNGIFIGKPSKIQLPMLQVFNPSTGKGQNATKANNLSMGQVKNFWLCEYLKMVGFYHCAVPRFVLAKQGELPKDRKTFALAPINITLEEHKAIFAKFRDVIGNRHAIKSDIFAALNYIDCFLQHCEAEAGASLAVELLGRAPENFVAGLHTAFYKDLGNSSAVMNLSFINLPHWTNVQNTSDVQMYREMIEEHLHIVRSLEEERSEGYQLLQHYRDFLSAHDFTAFFEFTARYPNYLLNALAKENFWVKPLSTTNLRRLLMSAQKELTPIIKSVGFQNIARAIRQSTVILQYRAADAKKQKKPKDSYDIRYGLGQELRRKANYPDEFIQALGDFLHSFNAENARVAEGLSQPWRKSVREDDIAEIVQLIDEHGPQTVCHLLLAFGYASTSRDDAPTTPTDTSSEDIPF